MIGRGEAAAKQVVQGRAAHLKQQARQHPEREDAQHQAAERLYPGVADGQVAEVGGGRGRKRAGAERDRQREQQHRAYSGEREEGERQPGEQAQQREVQSALLRHPRGAAQHEEAASHLEWVGGRVQAALPDAQSLLQRVRAPLPEAGTLARQRKLRVVDGQQALALQPGNPPRDHHGALAILRLRAHLLQSLLGDGQPGVMAEREVLAQCLGERLLVHARQSAGFQRAR